MKEVNFKKEINSNIDSAIQKITALLKDEGFGVLTRIDLHTKLKEKIDKDIEPTIILGSCNPTLAFEAIQINSDITSLLPCNVVIRAINEDKLSIEIAKPSSLIDILGESALSKMALDADSKIKRVMDKI
jgi:uncharacterized protein (DUF302 family)